MRLALLSIFLALPLAGCAHQTASAPVALAPGFSNTADQSMDEVLVGAHKFYTDIQGQITAGQYTPSVTEKTSLNSFGTALNAAQLIYNAYHDGKATQAQAQAAVDTVSNQQTALQNNISTGAK